jgi:thymidine kinase
MSIELIIGPMFSGKTSELQRRIKRFHYGNNNKKTIILKWEGDNRSESENTLKTHDGMEIECFRVSEKLLDGKGNVNKEILEKVKCVYIIGIDEGHFFENLIGFCEIMVNKHNKKVIVAALDSNFKREPFKDVCNLIPKCEEVTKLKAVCNICSKDASFSFKISESEKIIDVGSEEKYIPLCRTCYLNKNK